MASAGGLVSKLSPNTKPASKTLIWFRGRLSVVLLCNGACQAVTVPKRGDASRTVASGSGGGFVINGGKSVIYTWRGSQAWLCPKSRFSKSNL
jgi:hypothetical protein